MRLLIPLSLAVFGAGVGIATGHFLKPVTDTTVAPSAEHSVEAISGEEHADVHSETSSSDALAHANPTSDGTEFVKLNNQFIVPVLENGRVRSMVLLSLTLETPAGGKEAIYTREPKLRDGFLQVMFDYANAGGFDGTFTSARAMDNLRKALREEGRLMMGEMLVDVLVTDIARQDS